MKKFTLPKWSYTGELVLLTSKRHWCESLRNIIFYLILFNSSSPTWIISLLFQYFILLAGQLNWAIFLTVKAASFAQQQKYFLSWVFSFSFCFNFFIIIVFFSIQDRTWSVPSRLEWRSPWRSGGAQSSMGNFLSSLTLTACRQIEVIYQKIYLKYSSHEHIHKSLPLSCSFHEYILSALWEYFSI